MIMAAEQFQQHSGPSLNPKGSYAGRAVAFLPLTQLVAHKQPSEKPIFLQCLVLLT